MNIEQINQLCITAISTCSTEERKRAEEALKALKPNDYINILNLSNNEMAHFYVFNRLTKLIESEYILCIHLVFFSFFFLQLGTTSYTTKNTFPRYHYELSSNKSRNIE